MDAPFLTEIRNRFDQHDPHTRFLVGLAGPPASGKSWWAAHLPNMVNEELGTDLSTSFAMDGYHCYDAELQAKGLYPFKGSHFTFDVEAFIQKLIEIKESPGEVKCPIFDRSIDEPVQDQQIILPHHKLVFVEGNYLLSAIFPWNTIKYLLDYTVFIEVDENVQFERLMKRHMAIGRSEKESREKISRTDWVNSAMIRKDKGRANDVFNPHQNELS